MFWRNKANASDALLLSVYPTVETEGFRSSWLYSVDPTSTHEITTPVFQPSNWMNPNFSNGHIFRFLSYGSDVSEGNKSSMKISVLSTHHPSTVVLSWVAGSLWLEA
jgi:hypothetical protein